MAPSHPCAGLGGSRQGQDKLDRCEEQEGRDYLQRLQLLQRAGARHLRSLQGDIPAAKRKEAANTLGAYNECCVLAQKHLTVDYTWPQCCQMTQMRSDLPARICSR